MHYQEIEAGDVIEVKSLSPASPPPLPDDTPVVRLLSTDSEVA
jgi:hypothetical protein